MGYQLINDIIQLSNILKPDSKNMSLVSLVTIMQIIRLSEYHSDLLVSC